MPAVAAPPMHILTTKLYVPPARSQLVSRPRLTDQLQTGLAGKLTLISAPAGFGKTTLLAEWLAARTERRGVRTESAVASLGPQSSVLSTRVAWLSLDAGDNDASTFLRYLIAALQTLVPAVGAAALALLQTPQPPALDSLLTMLLNDLAAMREHTALVLDDYHAISAPPVHQAVSFLLDHLPPALHLVILTRVDPPLALARLRARGELAELRAPELRFTVDEAAAFLNDVMRLPLSTTDVAALEARTEGWIAGLHLAALAMRARADLTGFITAFADSNRFVVDYLTEEVLDRLPSHLQTFVLHTAALDRMCGSLCDAILGLETRDLGLEEAGAQQAPSPKPQASQAYSQLILEQLERANLFLIPLDDQRHWYRYHHLFAEVLRQRLQSGAAPAMVARLHRRASVWFAQQGLPAEAIQHALAARDVDRAAQLVEQAAPTLLASGEVTTVRSWLEAFPEQRVRTRPQLGLLYCWTLAFTAQFQDLEARLHDIMRAIDTATELLPEERRALVSEVTVLRTRVAFSRNEVPQLSDLHQALVGAPADDLRLRSLILLALGHVERLHGNALEASQAYAEANRLAQRTGDVFTAGSALVALAEHHEVRGQLHAAAEAHRLGLRLATTRDGRPLPLAGFFHVGLGKQLREWNDLDAATQHLQQGIALGQQGGMQGIALDGAITLALVLQARGDRIGADEMLDSAAKIAQTWGQPQIELRVATFAARLAIMRGRLPDAARWAHTNRLGVDDELSEWLEIEHCTLARWQIAERHAEHALRMLTRLAGAAELAGRTGRLIEILALQALAYRVQGETATALAHLGRALGLAAPEGYVRVFVDEGAPMAELLQLARARRVMPSYIATLLAAFRRTEGHEMRAESGEPSYSALSPQSSVLIEPLTSRELEVLLLIVGGSSNREIAAQLVITVGTVKRHINNLFGKLGVRSRTQAIDIARRLGLL